MFTPSPFTISYLKWYHWDEAVAMFSIEKCKWFGSDCSPELKTKFSLSLTLIIRFGYDTHSWFAQFTLVHEPTHTHTHTSKTIRDVYPARSHYRVVCTACGTTKQSSVLYASPVGKSEFSRLNCTVDKLRFVASPFCTPSISTYLNLEFLKISSWFFFVCVCGRKR